MGYENIKDKGFDSRTTEGQRGIARQGGIASGKVRREKADLKKQLLLFLESDATTDKHGNPLTGAELMVKVAVKEMTKGNSKYWELIRDTAGFKPVDKVMVAEVEQNVIDEVESMVEAVDDGISDES
jgi:hypothetical protein